MTVAHLVADVLNKDIICHREVSDVILICGQANPLCASGKLVTRRSCCCRQAARLIIQAIECTRQCASGGTTYKVPHLLMRDGACGAA